MSPGPVSCHALLSPERSVGPSPALAASADALPADFEAVRVHRRHDVDARVLQKPAHVRVGGVARGQVLKIDDGVGGGRVTVRRLGPQLFGGVVCSSLSLCQLGFASLLQVLAVAAEVQEYSQCRISALVIDAMHPY